MRGGPVNQNEIKIQIADLGTENSQCRPRGDSLFNKDEPSILDLSADTINESNLDQKANENPFTKNTRISSAKSSPILTTMEDDMIKELIDTEFG